MKKLILLGIAALALGFTAYTQPTLPKTLILYQGDKTTDFLDGTPYKFDAVDVVDSLFDGADNKSLYISGSTTGSYVGGAGNARYGMDGQEAISSAYTGAFADTKLGFSYTTQGTNATLKLQIKSAANTWGYIFDLSAGSATEAIASAKLSNFKVIVSDQPTGANLTESDFAAIDEVQFILGVSGTGGGNAIIVLDNLVLFEEPSTPTAEYILYSGNNAIDFINSDPYDFGNALSIKDSLKNGASDKFYYLSGVAGTDTDSPNYVGGVGTGSWGAGGNPTISYSGEVANTTVAFTANPKGTAVKLIIAFADDDKSKVWGYEFIIPASNSASVISAPLSSFKLRDEFYAFTGAVITEADLATVTKFEFGLTNNENPTGFTELEFDNLVLIDSNPTGINDSNIATTTFSVYPNPCNTGVLNLGDADVSYTMSTTSGSVVKSGVGNKVDVSNLEKGMYLISTGKGKVSKVILN